MFYGKVLQQLLYDVKGLTIADCARELSIEVHLDNRCTFSVLTKHFYDSKEVLHKCLRITAHNMMAYTANIGIIVYFDSYFLLHSKVTVQLQLLLCDTQL